MDFRVPVPGGETSDDENDAMETVPLTPRESTAPSSQSTELSLMERSKEYLAFFRSPMIATDSNDSSEQDSAGGSSSNQFYTFSQQPSNKIVDSNNLPVIPSQNEPEQSRYEPFDHEHAADTAQTGQSYYPSHYYAQPTPRSTNFRHTASPPSSNTSQSNEASKYSDNYSVMTSASHLLGESLISPSQSIQTMDDYDEEAGMYTDNQIAHQPIQNTKNSRVSIVTYQDPNPFRAIWRNIVDESYLIGLDVVRTLRTLRHPQTPLSPRSRNLTDLRYLTQQHKTKLQQISGSDSFAKPLGTDDDRFDFVLLLQPQEVYAFWSEILDFRTELLGIDAVEAMENNWSSLYDIPSPSQGPIGSFSTDETSHSSNSSEARDVVDDLGTPPTGIHRRRVGSEIRDASPSTISSQAGGAGTNALHRNSPGLYSLAECSRISSKTKNSLFDRAMEQPTTIMSTESMKSPEPRSDTEKHANEDNATHVSATAPVVPASQQRRRWGNQSASGYTPHAISPPVRSLTRGASTVKRPTVMRPLGHCIGSIAEAQDPNVLRIEDIPNQIIPRGIAARTNGMLPFLSALKRGIVVRRHRPGQNASFFKLSSNDGGDTIQFVPVNTDAATVAFKEQRVRHNKTLRDEASADNILQAWSFSSSEETDKHAADPFSVPDYVAARQYRDEISRKTSFLKKVNDLASQVGQGGSFKACDIIAVHPARNQDPRSSCGECGSCTLRKSKSDHVDKLTFSVVLRNQRLARGASSSVDELEEKWNSGEGNEALFRYIDFEVPTEGEYWLVFRGMLLLHRDAVIGRFAEQRAAGIGCHYPRLELEQREHFDLTKHNILHQDEFHEPVTASYLEKLIVKWRNLDPTYMVGYTLPEARPPPSDYFLGFRSPGTSIWSRLRQAGLETQRVYALDRRSVMIKIRCPNDRLMDVAEVLRLKLKTRDGSFAPFREDMIEFYHDLNDPLEKLSGSCDPDGFQFPSAFRQTIIDFIVGSRIRDTGAELGQNTDLGKLIQTRVPLHMPEKLDAIFNSWFYFWKKENFLDINPTYLTHYKLLPTDIRSQGNTIDKPTLKWYHRFFIGCFHQPLDSIEQYFGEKVAFYFAWLQHTASHLILLSIIGFILFLFQIGSGNWDHPLRPFFAMVVMLWTFTVLTNWRKRANYLAFTWGTMDYKEQEVARPQFYGDYIRDEITGEWVVTYPKWKRWLKYMISFPLTIIFTCGTLIIILWVHSNRDLQLAAYLNSNPEGMEVHGIDAITEKKQVVEVELTKENLLDPYFWYLVVGMPAMLGLCFPLLNFVLMKLSVCLNDFENYRTESEYRSFLIIKVFSFRFVCYFGTLYYYAFVSVGDKTSIQNGILRVASGVLVYTTVAQWWQNFVHVCFPMLIRHLRCKRRENVLTAELRAIEEEEEEISRSAFTKDKEEIRKRQTILINKRLLLEQAQDDVWSELLNPQHDSFPEYIQAVVQFTYVSCFSVVLPITPLLCLFNYLVSMRLDAYKLCKGRRRPLAEKTGGIGVWEHLLHIVAVISILTNCWLMGFTSSQFTWIADSANYVTLFAVVVGWEHIMLLIKYIVQQSVSPLPSCVRDAMKREQFELDQQRNSNIMARRLQHQREDELKESLTRKRTSNQSSTSRNSSNTKSA
jgi:anoctamin-10